MAKAKSGASKSRKIQSKSSKMPLFFVLGGVVILIVIAALFVFQNKPAPYRPEVTGGPSLQTNTEKVDLGDQKLGQTIQVSFQIKNVGDQPLVFTKSPYIEVKEGCCPSTPTIGSMSLKPGETTTLSFPMMMHEGMGGYHDFRVHIPNNDLDKKDMTLTVLSNWIP